MSISLNRYETMHLVHFGDEGDLTGTHIVADLPVAVISGNVKVPVPVTSGTSDHLCEMLTPVDTWGKR
jgi:hypothetical protein